MFPKSLSANELTFERGVEFTSFKGVGVARADKVAPNIEVVRRWCAIVVA